MPWQFISVIIVLDHDNCMKRIRTNCRPVMLHYSLLVQAYSEREQDAIVDGQLGPACCVCIVIVK